MTVHSIVYVFMSSLIALFPVLNPIGAGLIVNGYIVGLDESARRKAARTIFINCLLLAIGSLVVGHLILAMFGLAVPVIQAGGGLIICKTGYDMLTAEVSAGKSDPDRTADVGSIESKLFYPLSFPITIDPGTISVIFTLMATATVHGEPGATFVRYGAIALAIAVLSAVLYVFLLQGPRVLGKLSDEANLIIGKFVAFITFCIGIQILVSGISKIFHIAVL